MKFRKFLLNEHRLLNDLADDGADNGGGDDGDSGDDGGIDWSDDGDDSEDDQDILDPKWKDSFKDAGLDPDKYGLDEKEEVDPADAEQDPKAAQEKQGQPTDDTAFIEKLNGLGLVHNELPIKLESLDQVKNLIQMGHDYSAKTQKLSEERTHWDAEKKATEDELNAAITDFNTQYKQLESSLQETQNFKLALEDLKESDPDLFAEVQSRYDRVVKQYRNPVIDQQIQALTTRLNEAESQLKARESKAIVESFDSEFAQLDSTIASMKDLGVVVDKDKVKEKWKATGLPVKEVMGTMYFDPMAKAQASKLKVDAARTRTQRRPTGGAGASRPGSKVTAIDPKLSLGKTANALWDRYVK